MKCCTSKRAPMRYSHLLTAALIACACCLWPAASARAAATKGVVGMIGSTGGGGGQTAAVTQLVAEGGAPVVSGAGVSNVEATSALLMADIDPRGAETSYRAEYGTSESYGEVLPSAAGEGVGSGPSPVGVSMQLSDLSPGTLYYYRVVAESAEGSGEAAGTFTTRQAILPSVSTGSASGVTQNTAMIAGVVDTHGQAASYGFEIGTSAGEYGPATGLGYVGAGLEEARVSLSLTGLAPGTTYYYRVTASDVYGTSYGEVQSFTTAVFQSAEVVPPAPLPFVSVPSIAFPTQVGGSTGKGPKSKVKKRKGKEHRGKNAKKHRGDARHTRKHRSKRCAKQSRTSKARRTRCKKHA